MLESVSPYQLLRASIPKQNAATTPYDLYSLAQSRPIPETHANAGMQNAPDSAMDTNPRDGFRASQEQETATTANAIQASDTPQSPVHEPQTVPPRPAIPVRRTHYIADIKTRHTAAAKHTTFTKPTQG